MALGPRRITEVTQSPFPHERAGLALLAKALPDVDPYHMWSNALLLEGSRSYEIDAIVIGKHCLYLVELKAWEGEIRGDVQDWYVLNHGRETYHPNPVRLAETKAKAFKSRLQAKVKNIQVPWVEPLVFLHGGAVKLRMDEATKNRVVVGDEIGRAITHRDYRGHPADLGPFINRPLMEELKRGIAAIPLKASEKNNYLGDYRIHGQLEDGDLYQDLLVKKPDLGGRDVLYRLRVFPTELEPEGPRRDQLARAAVREERTLVEVSGHPYVLKAQPGFKTPRGPAIPMEHLPDAVTLFNWIESHAGASRELRIRLIQQISEALAHCHARRVVHRNLSPAAVLVTGGDDPKVKLRNFGLAHRVGTHMTGTGSLTTSEREKLYRAPEVFTSVEQANEVADVFSLGAVAFFVLTGKDPARDLRERAEILEVQKALRPSLVEDGFARRAEPATSGAGRAIDQVVAMATDADPDSRWPSATEFLNELLLAAKPAESPAPFETTRTIDPLAARPDDVIAPGLVVERLLGSGATAVVYLVRQDDHHRVLKVARDARSNDFLQGEARTLENLKHQRIVALKQVLSIDGHDALLLDMAGETTLSQYLRDEGAVTLDFAGRWGRELLETVQYLEERGVTHRDLKPSNIGLEIVGKKQQKSILLFDFSHSHLPRESIDSGTEAYRDPHLALRGVWDHHAEHYSAALVLYEMLTGTLPRRPRIPTEAAAIAPEALVESGRELLTAFFTRALAVKAADRFPSAQELLQAWNDATSVKPTATRVAKPIDQVTPATPVYELALSEPARNALDRNRVFTAGDLARFHRNRIFVMKGVGQKVARELDGLAKTLRDQFHIEPATPIPDPLVPDYPQEPHALVEEPGPLPPEAVERLADAGITTDAELAARSAADLEPLLLDAELLIRVREHLEARRNKIGPSPATLNGWMAEALRGLPSAKKSKKDRQLLEQLLGLQPFGNLGPTDAPTQVQLARATEGCSQARLSRLLLSARSHWIFSRIEQLRDRLARLVHREGGALPLPRVVRRFLETLGSEATNEALRQAAFLVRVACETDNEETAVLRRRLRGGLEIIEAIDDLWPQLVKLAATADKLANDNPLASVQRAAAVIEHEVDRLKLVEKLDEAPPPGAAAADEPAPDRSTMFWLRLAVDLSQKASLSRRGEVYPRDLEPVRLIELLGSSLAPLFTVEELKQQIRERYPDASAPLPDGEPLRELLGGRGYVWDESAACFRRRGEIFLTQYRTSVPTHLTRGATPARSTARLLEAAGLRRELVSERLVTAARGRSFRALMVAPQRLEAAVRRLTGILERAAGKAPATVSVDLGIVRHLRGLVAEIPREPGDLEIWDQVIEADAAGPDSEGTERDSWDEMARYAARAADAFLDDLLAHTEPGAPVLLRDVGLVARFRLKAFLERLAHVAEADTRVGSIFLIVPQSEAAPSPFVNDVLEVPATPGQAMRLHREWVFAGEATGGGESA